MELICIFCLVNPYQCDVSWSWSWTSTSPSSFPGLLQYQHWSPCNYWRQAGPGQKADCAFLKDKDKDKNKDRYKDKDNRLTAQCPGVWACPVLGFDGDNAVRGHLQRCQGKVSVSLVSHLLPPSLFFKFLSTLKIPQSQSIKPNHPQMIFPHTYLSVSLTTPRRRSFWGSWGKPMGWKTR